ncbi:sialate O-acetylesterase [Synoicihabitans lomoniglobus]|uniref:Sialate O-acetylesterase n=1 Tax=Synoicihabitans lomoniglobus TaxID=2909285 RepID=A0AAF0CLR7_9BACT|nr:sialate O-acetylesterase [Opitutaceae bacterium LMO-M01]WED63168.1 sialate O-acetylesterase [Opitutaceae bacterium LMO-M01]
MPTSSRLRLLLAAVLIATAVHAAVTPAPPFADGAVLQRDKPIAVWGTADPTESVTVSFHDHTVSTTAAADGRWSVTLPALPADSRNATLTIAGTNEITVADVVVGDVWLLSGQSNMEWPLKRANDADNEIAAANHPLIRHLKVQHRLAAEPRIAVDNTGWVTATAATAGEFSAIGYFFAREVQAEIGVPIGLLNISWGGSPIERWTSAEAIATQPDPSLYRTRFEAEVASYPERLAHWEHVNGAYEADRAVAEAAGEQALAAFDQTTRRPWKPGNPAHHHGRPSSMFNAMMTPFVPYGIRGMLWYQGEANANRHGEYRDLFTAMITDWRAKFGQGDLPFYWVQLTNFHQPARWEWDGREWGFLREAQTQSLALPNTAQAVIVDIGNNFDIHPRNKQDVGARLAAIALTRIHGIPRETSGPTFAGVTRDGPRLRVGFDHVAGGLVARDGAVRELEIAGADGVFHPARGDVVGSVLIVSSPQVPEPVDVRYAFTNGLEVNLFGANGLPVAPFRSDDR